MRFNQLVTGFQALLICAIARDCSNNADDPLGCPSLRTVGPANEAGTFKFVATDLDVSRGASATAKIVAFDFAGKPLHLTSYDFEPIHRDPGISSITNVNLLPDTAVVTIGIQSTIPTNISFRLGFEASASSGNYLVPLNDLIVHVKQGTSSDFLISAPSELLLDPGTPDSMKITIQRFAGAPALGPIIITVTADTRLLKASFNPNPVPATEGYLVVVPDPGAPHGWHHITISGTSAGLTRSADQSVLISPDWKIIPSGSSSALNGIAMIDDFVAVAAGGNGTTSPATIVRTTNGGGSWTSSGVSFGQAGNNAVSFNLHGVGLVASDKGSVYWSPDYGVSWTHRQVPLSSVNLLGALMSQVNDSSAVVVGTGGSVFTTANAGISWTQGTSNTTADLYSVSSSVSGGTKFAVGASGTIIQSSTIGTTWTATTIASVTLRSVFAWSSTRVSVVGDGGMILHTDDATHWQIQSSPVGNDLRCITFAQSGTTRDLNIGYIVGAGSIILATVDGGGHWARETIATGFDLNGISKLTLLSSPALGRAFAVGSGGFILTK